MRDDNWSTDQPFEFTLEEMYILQDLRDWAARHFEKTDEVLPIFEAALDAMEITASKKEAQEFLEHINRVSQMP